MSRLDFYLIALVFILGTASTAYGGAFLDSGGTFTTISVPGAYSTDAACGINDSGDIVGVYISPTLNPLYGYPANGFSDVGGTFTTINVPGAGDTVAEGINNSGVIVGYYQQTSSYPSLGTAGFIDT